MSLTPRPGTLHLIVAEAGDGLASALALLDTAGDGFRAAARLLHTGEAPAGPAVTVSMPDEAALVRSLTPALARARMGTRLYLAGGAGFVARLTALALDHGFDHGMIETDVRSHGTRRVQCVHCKHVIEDVTGTVVTCDHCGLRLGVRDLYSRRLQAHLGVCILDRPAVAS
ncbi:dimethylamine monooxygenase subunit DmmA family protein [Zavarzinia sp.]|uniref:dimethylamine monooxygenase subunit DmmA family protein n=1 Tax=Zavarzinia sp. TaxID=2027920 RepID=UPI00356A39D5